METKGELAKAIIAVMKAVKGIEKSMTIGSGSMSYKGVPDQEVKKIIGDAMEKSGLCILPIGVDAKTQVDRWEETTVYNNTPSTKMKQSVFTEATTKYLLLHTSGESQVLEGYGQGVDSQDKSAGKATTYALKYTLLYTFLVPTGKIDDADNTHSDEIATPQTTAKTPTPPNNNLGLSEELKTIGEKVGTIKTLVALEAYWNDDLTTEQKANEIVKNLFGKRKLQLKAK